MLGDGKFSPETATYDASLSVLFTKILVIGKSCDRTECLMCSLSAPECILSAPECLLSGPQVLSA